MSEKFRPLPIRKIRRALKRLGFVFRWQTGSHLIYRRGSKTISIPNHREVAPGTLRKALKEAGVSMEEFMEAYRKRK